MIKYKRKLNPIRNNRNSTHFCSPFWNGFFSKIGHNNNNNNREESVFLSHSIFLSKVWSRYSYGNITGENLYTGKKSRSGSRFF